MLDLNSFVGWKVSPEVKGQKGQGGARKTQV